MKRIEIVTHCWAGRHRHYAQGLIYQLSSLVLDTPQKCHVTATVCHDPEDADTVRVFRWFRSEFQSDRLAVEGIELPIRRLGRRAIGRNIAALRTEADLVWFTDCDHAFADGVLDRLAGLSWPEGASMIYPRRIRIHRDHGTGDAALARADRPALIGVDKDEFAPKRYARAIGGVQIVQGGLARRRGYLDGEGAWQEPLVRDTFVSCRCDLAYRTRCRESGTIAPVDLPGVYRLRHTATTHHEGRSRGKIPL